MKNHLYSLTELTVASAILLLPFTFIIQAFDIPFNRAQQVRCLSHFNHLWAATHQYMLDYNYTLPHEDKGLNQPPSDSSWTQVLNISPYEYGVIKYENEHDLKMNSRLEGYKGTKPYPSPEFRKVESIKHPSQTPYIFDGRIDGWYFNKMYGSPKSIAPRHLLETNFLFMDGSARAIFSTPHPEGGWTGHGNLYWDPDVNLESQAL